MTSRLLAFSDSRCWRRGLSPGRLRSKLTDRLAARGEVATADRGDANFDGGEPGGDRGDANFDVERGAERGEERELSAPAPAVRGEAPEREPVVVLRKACCAGEGARSEEDDGGEGEVLEDGLVPRTPWAGRPFVECREMRVGTDVDSAPLVVFPRTDSLGGLFLLPSGLFRFPLFCADETRGWKLCFCSRAGPPGKKLF